MNYTLVRARKRTLSLQVNRQGEVVARAPLLMPKFLIDRFVAEKESWIEKRKQELARPLPPQKEYYSEDALKKYIAAQVKEFSSLMRLHPAGIRFTTVTSYWGTCSLRGMLSFNLALRFAPSAAVQYVIVHELAHLRWRGHGKRFWDLVETTYPKTREMRALLRKNYRIR